MALAATETKTHWSASPFPLTHVPEKPEDVPIDFYHCAVVMTGIHNIITRGLNSIYNHAPLVVEKGTTNDKADFITFSLSWYDFVHAHHTGEELWFFPEIDHATGETDVMQANVNQHEVFQKPLGEFNTYFVEVRKSPETLDASRVKELIDAFASALIAHLGDEIPTLLELGRRFPNIPIAKMDEVHGKKMVASVDKSLALPMFFTNSDRAFEGGKWSNVFPPIPGIVRILTKWVFSWKYRGAWRFSAANFDMDLKPNMLSF
ncbi:hypothetical protein BKA62DRAFT_703446 [Auriculariales sp. MPI-PUGE-AT-0066]|nr:hypothetical protein BKA62DRAFT_703446 [Auriculariales sp. MPI-PUGE-AT-0066]